LNFFKTISKVFRSANYKLVVISALCLQVCPIAFWVPAQAAESQFGFVYTTDLLPKGEKEIEQWVTWRHQKIAGSYDLLEGKTAYEYGLTDDFQVALYASYAWNRANTNGPFGVTTPPEQFGYDRIGTSANYSATRFIGFSVEEIWRMLSPYMDPFGLALYMEPTLGSRFFEFESRLILQKNYWDDTLVLGLNFTYAPEFRLLPNDDGNAGNAWKEEADVNLAIAASYRFARNWSVGFEAINEREFSALGFSDLANSGYYLGPSFHYGAKSFFVTGVALKQFPWATEHAATVPGAVVNGVDYDNDFELYRVRLKMGIYL